MREMVVGPADAGKRLDRFLTRALPRLSAPLAQKFIRLKRVKVNGRGAQGDTRLQEGDALSLYIDDAFFEQPRRADPFLSKFRHRVTVVYEDENLLLADKQPGLLTHPDASERLNTLVMHVRAYLYQKGEWDACDASQFAPTPVNRIDRFTGGIVIFAKTREAMRVLNAKIRARELDKRYLCVLCGAPERPGGMLRHYLLKDEARARVRAVDGPMPGAQLAQTRYRVLARAGALSLAECALLTGRTHQIRVQFAAVGCPLLGDTQYGDARMNRRWAMNGQALYAYRLDFAFRTDAGALSYLAGRSFQVRAVAFARQLFPDVDIGRVGEGES